MTELHPKIPEWFQSRNWKPFSFQCETWQRYLEGDSGLLHAPTGFGKTLSVWLGPVSETLRTGRSPRNCEVLWITPLRALANDTLESLRKPLAGMSLGWSVEARTGDTSSYRKAKLREKFPYCLVTTPESLSLLLTYADTRQKLSNLKCVIVDEWHELLGTKRGVQAELCLTRLRTWLPELRIWGLSATLGNLEDAAKPLMGSNQYHLVAANQNKQIEIKTLIPDEIESFPWSGHLGTKSVKRVAKQLEKAQTTLVFTNTRSQAEIWYQEMQEARPEWSDEIAIHHGSLSRDERGIVEAGLNDGSLRCVICTSSLDLGVDFSPVDQVIQIGSPKGIARLTQRAGRAGHSPGKVSKIICVPTNALELVEFSAARDAWNNKEIESRTLLKKPLDVLTQHLTTLVLGEPASPEVLKKEIFSAFSYSTLTKAEWNWAIMFLTNGGPLSAYPQYQKAELIDGLLTVTNKRTAQLHRMNIGTITSDTSVLIKFASGRTLGSVEEGFASRLKVGKQFVFAGRRLELIRFHKLTATVRAATKVSKGEVAIWGGSKMPLSTELSHAVARSLHSTIESPELKAVAPILKIQKSWSTLPSDKELLIEFTRTREGEHLFVYAFAGRLVNEGLGALVAFRLSRNSGESINVTQNDYGFCLGSPRGLPLDEEILREALTIDQLLEDLLECMNTAEMARRQFRYVARVAGLLIPDMPGKRKPTGDLQVSANLLFEVFSRYDPDNLLLEQARREILEHQLELERLKKTLASIQDRPFRLIETRRLTPMAFPLWADRLSAFLPAGDAATRLEKMLAKLQKSKE
ncbi:MAG: ligase-associated DNA damage response DEXH box helicase [Akkermansiaceae bacterium]|nr:ligase-associated DNA damage response DEXH box helicase [Akkermansiaceae bacterium]